MNIYSDYRQDIDGLRAIAVISVIYFHAFPNLFPGGYIGVDIFFVISGYLISKNIIKSIEHFNFSILDFYSRRVTRIFPALITVIFGCLIFGWFALSADEFKQIGKHVFGGATFISNLILWRESGYFDESANAKPLLHLWSLGIEEQFYIIWPLLLYAIWRNKLKAFIVITVITITSFFLNLYLIRIGQNDTAFYFPITRLWELTLGAMLFYILLFNQLKKLSIRHVVRNLLSFLGIILIFYGLWKIQKDYSYPGWWALIPVMGTSLIIIAGPEAWINKKILSNKFATWMGSISYPLYLWHWPLITFSRILNGQSELNFNILLFIICTSIFLAWLTKKYIEKPFQNSKNNRKNIIISILMIIIGVIGLFVYILDGVNSRIKGPQVEVISNEFNCINGENEPICELGNRTSSKRLLALGDSHLRVLIPQLIDQFGDDYSIDAVQSSSCFMSNTIKFEKIGDEKDCEKHINALINLKGAYYDSVVTAQRWHGYNIIDYHQISDAINDRISLFGINFKVLIILGATADVPIDCEKSKLRPLKINHECSQYSETKTINRNFIEITNSMPIPSNVKFIYPYNIFCPNNECIVSVDGQLNYSDMHHLSNYGAKSVVLEIAKFIKQ